jgi:hypothetical protein
VSRPRRSASTGAGPGDPSALEPTATVTLPGTTEVHVVGDAAYQDVLLELTGGRRHDGGVRMETVARLVPGPGGPDHPASATVAIAGRTVGYPSRPDAAHLGSEIAAAIERSGQATCAAVIVGGWEREHGDIGFFGVRLRIGALPGTAGSPVDPRRRGGDHRP